MKTNYLGRSVLASFVLLLSAGMLVSCATEQEVEFGDGAPPVDPRTPLVMHEKLMDAHDILDALVTEQFDVVARKADHLTTLSEHSDWFVHATASYGVLSEHFRRSTRSLAEQARVHDAAGVANAYSAMVRECIACHDYLRKEGLTRDMPGRIAVIPTLSQNRGG